MLVPENSVVETNLLPVARVCPDFTLVVNVESFEESLVEGLDDLLGPVRIVLQRKLEGVCKALLSTYVTRLNALGLTVNDVEAAIGAASLQEIFKARESNGVFREGTNEIEKTIFIKSPTSVRYGDVVKVIDAAKMAGASPIGLQIDDLSVN